MSDGRRKIMVVGDRASAAAATHFHDRGDYVLAVDVREHTTRGPTICSATCVMRRASAPCSARSVVAVASTAALGWDQRLETLAGLLELPDAEAVEQWQADKDPSYPVYSTSKQAVILYRKRLAGPAWTKYGVRVNTVSPVPVETPILSDFEQTMGKDVLDMCRATVGRHASVDDIVPVISFLGSPEARWITAQDIQADAGFINSMIAGAPIQL
jgi:NAD(P)-dependent dehydrogenase (short-subunit alcohol dehydrogenase family)